MLCSLLVLCSRYLEYPFIAIRLISRNDVALRQPSRSPRFVRVVFLHCPRRPPSPRPLPSAKHLPRTIQAARLPPVSRNCIPSSSCLLLFKLPPPASSPPPEPLQETPALQSPSMRQPLPAQSFRLPGE